MLPTLYWCCKLSQNEERTLPQLIKKAISTHKSFSKLFFFFCNKTVYRLVKFEYSVYEFHMFNQQNVKSVLCKLRALFFLEKSALIMSSKMNSVISILVTRVKILLHTLCELLALSNKRLFIYNNRTRN